MRRIRDLVLYILIACVIVIAVIASTYWAPLQKVSDQSFVKWGGLSGNTMCLFWWAIKQYRRFWRKRVFWWTMVGLLLVHVAIFWVILINVQQWRMAWFLVICTLEVIPIFAVLDWTMRRFRVRRGKNHQS